jgi:hypothetical protein
MLRVVRGRVPMTPFQKAFARAGHAHAGVLVIAALICQMLADAAGMTGFQGTLAGAGGRSRRSCSRPAFSSPRWGRSNGTEPADLAVVRRRGRAGRQRRIARAGSPGLDGRPHGRPRRQADPEVETERGIIHDEHGLVTLHSREGI